MSEVGYNYRITDIQCALASSQLEKLELFIERRREITKIYANESSGFAEVELALENAEGKKTTPASALIELPKKNK